MKKILNQPYVVLAVCLILVLSKVFLIEFDPPKWDIAYLQPADELYYVFVGYNYYETGSLWGADNPAVFGNPWLSNFVTYLTLNIFGDNFYGLRLSSVFFSLVSVFFFWKIVRTITENKYAILLSSVFLSINYAFTLSTIFVEPTIARIAAMLVSLYLIQRFWMSNTVSNRNLVLLAVSIFLLWIFTYPTNVFIILAFCCIVVYKVLLSTNFSLKKSLTKLMPHLVMLFIGFFIGTIVWALFSFALGENPLHFFDRGQHYSGRVAFGVKKIILNVLSVSNANIFLFNHFLLLVSIFSLIFSAFLFVKKSIDVKIIPVFFFVVAFLIQTIFINDFPQRKLIILLPLLLFLAVNLGTNEYRKIKKHAIAFKGAVVLSILGGFALISINKYIGAALLSYHSLLFSFILLFPLGYNLIKHRYTLTNWILVFLLVFGLEFVNTYEYSLKDGKKNYLEVSESLKIYNNSNFIGGWSMGFRSNNSTKVFLNKYLYYGQFDKYWQITDSIAKDNAAVDYSVGYAADSIEYGKINFAPIRTLMTAEQSVYKKDWVLYKEQ